MKKRWETPRTVVQGFEPNEYVAACWGVACFTDQANAYEISHGNWDNGGISHRPEHCGSSTNQAIHTDSNNNPTSMTEVGTDGLGNLPCTLYADPYYNNLLDISEVDPGETIYWTTTAGNRTWHHVGRVEETYAGHPNRS